MDSDTHSVTFETNHKHQTEQQAYTFNARVCQADGSRPPAPTQTKHKHSQPGLDEKVLRSWPPKAQTE